MTLTTFPDQSSLNMVRDALWKRTASGASVMVGAGFSRNAVAARLNPTPLPTWVEVGKQLYRRLNPSATVQQLRGAPDNILRVAQEYEAGFGRTALNHALRSMVRDLDYNPGCEHTRLLRLKWEGVYTTNWDTLLERTCPSVPGRAYNVICSKDQIPMANRPRIVKLHGSLPAQFPLIVTEEDYRTYPDKFAAFVNTVQQAMMETVFLLVGFSGDDPNFLSWSGWVRDNFGSSAPKIYLAGFLDLPRHRRRMLEDMNVALIDLAQHPNARSWPPTMVHNHATQWLLHSLERGRTYDVLSWPAVPDLPSRAIPCFLQPVEIMSSEQPLPEPDDQLGEPKSSIDAIRELLSVWHHNRRLYPGWLTLPSSKRSEAAWRLEEWGRRVLDALPSLAAVDGLYVMSELVWRNEILYEPIFSDFETGLEHALGRLDCVARTIDGELDPDADWAKIREAWRNCAVALVTAARYRDDRETFERRTDQLRPFFQEDPDIKHRVQYELCLYALMETDNQELDSLVYQWDIMNCDPVWWLRKSAVMREAGHDDDAEELLQRAITELRAMAVDEGDLAGHAREAWALFAAVQKGDRHEYEQRVRELSALLCDPRLDRQAVLEDLRRGRVEEVHRPFDPDIERFTWTSDTRYRQIDAAYRAIRLSEVVGLPPFADQGRHIPVWGDVLRECATVLADSDVFLAVRLVLRSGGRSTDKTIERVLTRARVATLSSGQFNRLVQACFRVIDYSLPHVIATASHTARAGVAIEVLSHLAIRMGPQQSEDVLDRVITYCQNPQLYHTQWGRQIGLLLRRSWEALPDDRRRSRALNVLSIPIVGLNQDEPPRVQDWPDPADHLRLRTIAVPRRADDPNLWQAAVDLVTRSLAGEPISRRRGSRRLALLVRSGDLNDDELRGIAETLWVEQHMAADGLPGDTELHDWAFIFFPEHEVGIAETRFRAKWLQSNNCDSAETSSQASGPESVDEIPCGSDPTTRNLDQRLWQVGAALDQSRREGRGFELSTGECELLVDLLGQWSETPVPDLPDKMSHHFHFEATRRTLTRLPAVIDAVDLPQSVGEKLFAKMRKLNDRNVPSYSLAGSLTASIPERLNDIATSLSTGLLSDCRKMAENAAEGFALWLQAASVDSSNIQPPPDTLFRDIGMAVASRRSSSLIGALEAATWIFLVGSKNQKDIVLPLVLIGLEYLAQEAQYERDGENDLDISLVRHRCAQLVRAMANSGYNELLAVATWLEAAADDPLAEVRHAVVETIDPRSEITEPEDPQTEQA